MHLTTLRQIPGFDDALLDLAVHLAVLLLLRDIHRLRLPTLRHAPLNAGQLGRRKSMFLRVAQFHKIVKTFYTIFCST